MEDLLKKYAKLTIHTGLHLQPGQPLVIQSSLEAPQFTRYVVEEAYKVGASKVEVVFEDPMIQKMNYLYPSMDTLEKVDDWKIQQKEVWMKEGYAMMTINSIYPSLLQDVEPERIKKANQASAKAFLRYREYRASSQSQWLGCAIPNKEWAQMVFPECSSEGAMKRLWQAIFYSCRINDQDDPVLLWQEHIDTLLKRRQKLTDYSFTALHFKNGLGTDLTVGLVEGHQWAGGEEKTPSGLGFTPNLPTEEIFCMPDKMKVSGKVVATKPLHVQGKLVEDFYFVFKDGKVIEHYAKKNQAALDQLLSMDEGARYLGEVALIDHDSPISKMNVVFYNTLFDENASCHLALGNCYASNFKDYTKLTKEDMISRGANFSMIHCDFMFGSADLNVDGITKEGNKIPIMVDGHFVI